jgi:hypothetical protein
MRKAPRYCLARGLIPKTVNTILFELTNYYFNTTIFLVAVNDPDSNL